MKGRFAYRRKPSPPPPRPFSLNAPKRPRLADADLYQTGMFHDRYYKGSNTCDNGRKKG
uniref:Uncharacterized protein n=1 Tax=Desertifilum tharense IPPAS B-1220 TaxID=1781255 RepID=A0ACD5GS14_9CYAN